MSIKKQKLELTWVGKDEKFRLEPRILIEDSSKSYGDPKSENLLIHGDNLLALKALEAEFTGKIKCIYIDPPYNTGSAFEHYDDNLEHSTWLNLMKPRLELLKNLLSEEGTIWINIDQNELHYLKVLCDEIFGRSNYLTMITTKAKAAGGVGQESYLFDLCEYVLIYAKNNNYCINHKPFVTESLGINVTNVYNKILESFGKEKIINKISGGIVGNIDVIEFNDFNITSLNSKEKTDATYYKNFDKIFRTTNPQGGLMKRVIPQIPKNGLYAIEYIPSKGKRSGEKYRYYFLNGSLIVWLKDSAKLDVESKKVLKLIKNNNLWVQNLHQGIAAEGGVEFRQSKKPEHLIKNILEIASSSDDYVLDSFLGSGTTSAVAHKMRRRWIGIELGEHAYTHCAPRLKSVIGGSDQSGISKSLNWKGGGGFKFYELAPSLLRKDSFGNYVIDEKYNANMLAAAMCKHENFKYFPNEKIYWKQGKSTETDFIFVTTGFVTVKQIDKISSEMKEGESLLICAKSFASECENKYSNITIKKIPQIILGKCEFAKDNYDLSIIKLSEVDVENSDSE